MTNEPVRVSSDPDNLVTRPRGRPLPAALGVALRIAVTAGLLWLLFSRIDVARLGEIFANLSYAPLAAAVAALVLVVPVNALRWHYILSAAGGSPGIGRLTKIVFVGLFFNQVLPTGIGGDAVRAWRCHLIGIPIGSAIRSILLDRAAGYAMIVLVYAAALPVLLRMFTQTAQQQVLLLVFAVALGGLVALLCMDLLPGALLRLKFVQSLATLSVQARRLLTSARLLSIVAAASVAGVALNIWIYQFIGQSVGANLSFLDWTVILPPVVLVQLVPVSLAGWGVREAALVVVMSAFGVAADLALATSLLFGICQLLVGLPGGILWLLGSDIAGAEMARVEADRPTPASERVP